MILKVNLIVCTKIIITKSKIQHLIDPIFNNIHTEYETVKNLI